MAEYYLDIETVPKDPEDPNDRANLNPTTGKIITIQYQRVETISGAPIGPLKILTEWDKSEREILEEFLPLFTGNPWAFIPLGYNLNFEFNFLRKKSKEYFSRDLSVDEFLDRPKNDLKLVGVILNNGSFKGATLDSFTEKEHGGYKIPVWYKDERHDQIIDYVTKETHSFLTFWQKLKEDLPKVFLK
ncbi:hypothetical protein ACFLQ6_00125 [Thermoproteota archaeon]